MRCPQCGAGLPPASRFCNACGTPVSADAPTTTTRHPGAPGPMPAPQPHAAPVHMPLEAPAAAIPPPPYPEDASTRRRPVIILAAVLALLTIGTVTGGLALTGRLKSPLLAGRNPGLPAAPGVAAAGTPGAGPAPTPLAGGSPSPTPGAPLTSTAGKPEDLAPGMMLAPGSTPEKAPSVVAVPTPELPAGPSPLAGQSPPLQGPGMTAAPATPAPSAPPRDNSDFDRYLGWMKFVENERAGLRAYGETQIFSITEDYLHAMLEQANETADGLEFQRRIQARLQGTLLAIRKFEQNVVRTKPPVPPDCRALDQFYMAALSEETSATPRVMQGLANGDIGAIRRAGQEGVASIDRNLGRANLALEEVYRGRGLNPQFRIQTGRGSSFLGGLTGLGGFMGM